MTGNALGSRAYPIGHQGRGERLKIGAIPRVGEDAILLIPTGTKAVDGAVIRFYTAWYRR